MRWLLLGICCALLGVLAPAAQADTAALWAFADARASELDRYWNGKIYATPSDGVHINTALLTLHARAQLAGHQGASRQDERIPFLADRLSSPPVYLDNPAQASGGDQRHIPGFGSALDRVGGQHVSFDMQIMNALALALQTGLLEPELAQRIRTRLRLVAQQPVFQYPALALNQINWPLQVQVAAARADGDWAAAVQQSRLQLRRWVAGMRRPMPGHSSPNLSQGLGLFYLPGRPQNALMNRVSTTEYANLIYGGLDVYPLLLQHGMPPLSDAERARLQIWAHRLLAGDWTHGGWPNWDSGHGLARWQLLRYWAWSAEALVTMASTPQLARPSDASRASWLLNRVLERYQWLADRGLVSTRYGVRSTQAHLADPQLTAARMAQLAARAASGPLASERQPGAWSWWDPQLHRLTYSSAAYSAAVVAPISTPRYGGLELSRLLDSQGRVLTSLGADGVQSGLRWRPRGGRQLRTQALVSGEGGSLQGWKVRGANGVRPSLGACQRRLCLRHRFDPGAVRTTYALPGSGQVQLRIPLWGQVQLQTQHRGRQWQLETTNQEGARLRLQLWLPRGARLRVLRLPGYAASPATRRQLRWSWYQRGPGRAALRLQPLS